jgi:hypothetical protein
MSCSQIINTSHSKFIRQVVYLYAAQNLGFTLSRPWASCASMPWRQYSLISKETLINASIRHREERSDVVIQSQNKH